jgi:hypothetical protein
VTLKTQITADLAVIFNTDEFAENVTYTPKNGLPATVPAIIARDAPLQEPYVRGADTAECVIWVKASDVEDPQHGDIYNFDSARWRGSGKDVISGDWEMAPEGIIYRDDDILELALQRKME